MTEPGLRLDTAQVQGPRGHVFVRMMDRNSGAADTTALLFLHPVNLTGQCWIGVAQRMRDVLCVLIALVADRLTRFIHGVATP